MKKRTCEICGARVENLNPDVTTCGPICTEAKHKGRTHKHQMRIEAERASKLDESCLYCGHKTQHYKFCHLYHQS